MQDKTNTDLLGMNQGAGIKDIIDGMLTLRLRDRKDAAFLLSAFRKAATLIEKPEDTQIDNDVNLALSALDDASVLMDYLVGTQDFMLSIGRHLSEDELIHEALNRFSLLRDVNDSEEGIPYYDPQISSLKAFETYFYEINKPMSYMQPGMTPVNDIFKTVFHKIKGFCEMMTMGLYADAFVSWRTLHESECMIKLLITGGEKVRAAYVRHLAYSNFQRSERALFTKEELDQGFAMIKKDMAKHDLKSKDMKHFIEYGWVYEHPGYDPEDKDFRLTFRKGIEKIAGLEDYSDIYEASSEITHASSIFFYVNDEFCKGLALTLYYETAYRIGELFMAWVKPYFDANPDKQKKAEELLGSVKTMSDYFDKKYDIRNLLKDVTPDDEA